MTKRTLPLFIGLSALFIIGGLYLLRSRPVERPRENVAPLVRAMQVALEPYQYIVRTHGTVAPRSESDLVPQVSGEVVWVSPALAVGGFFERGEVLVRIDRADYEADLESRKAAVARADSEYRRARKERDRQRRLADRSVASESRIDDAENAFRVADAMRREAQAALGRAERDLDRTELRAPYDGRVRTENVDVGQFVSRGNAMASLYAVDFVEVRLPLPDRELAFLDLPLFGRSAVATPVAPASAASVDSGAAASADAAATPGDEPAEPAEPADLPRVRLHAEFAGARHVWQGAVVRTEGELDAKTRMVNVVARVADPYAPSTGGAPSDAKRPPLAVGLFVEAEILGRRVEAAALVPRTALREGGRVYVIDAAGVLSFRDVEVLRTERENVVIGSGLRNGERICVSPMGAAVDGMRVRVAGDPAELAEVAP